MMKNIFIMISRRCTKTGDIQQTTYVPSQNGEEFTADGVDCAEKWLSISDVRNLRVYIYSHNASGLTLIFARVFYKSGVVPKKLYSKVAGSYICTIMHLNSDT